MSNFAAFVRERRYLHNVSPSTVSWYTHAFKWLPSESPSQDELKDAVMRMRAKGLKETGCNANIRAINSYLHWSSGSERKCGPGCRQRRIQQLKEPQNIMPTFTAAQIERLVQWRPGPKNFYERRLHLIVLLLLDTG
jgi:integrase/recombinase XerD